MSKLDEAIEYVEREREIEISDVDRNLLVDKVDSMIEDFEENGKVADALSFVDNLIVNFDFVAMVHNHLDIFEEE